MASSEDLTTITNGNESISDQTSRGNENERLTSLASLLLTPAKDNARIIKVPLRQGNGHAILIIPPEENVQTPTSAIEKELEPALSILKSFAGFFITWRGNVQPKLTPIYLPWSTNSFTPSENESIELIAKKQSYRIFPYKNGMNQMEISCDNLKTNFELKIFNVWRCSRGYGRTMKISIPPETDIGSLHITRQVSEGAVLENLLSGRKFLISKSDTGSNPGIKVYDEINSAEPVAEALATSGFTMTRFFYCFKAIRNTDYHEFKTNFKTAANLTVTDKFLLIACIMAWVADMKESGRQRAQMKTIVYVLLLIIYTILIYLALWYSFKC